MSSWRTMSKSWYFGATVQSRCKRNKSEQDTGSGALEWGRTQATVRWVSVDERSVAYCVYIFIRAVILFVFALHQRYCKKPRRVTRLVCVHDEYGSRAERRYVDKNFVHATFPLGMRKQINRIYEFCDIFLTFCLFLFFYFPQRAFPLCWS